MEALSAEKDERIRPCLMKSCTLTHGREECQPDADVSLLSFGLYIVHFRV